jgi:hypothetical protein
MGGSNSSSYLKKDVKEFDKDISKLIVKPFQDIKKFPSFVPTTDSSAQKFTQNASANNKTSWEWYGQPTSSGSVSTNYYQQNNSKFK